MKGIASALRSHPSLRSLDLSGNDIGDEGVEELLEALRGGARERLEQWNSNKASRRTNGGDDGEKDKASTKEEEEEEEEYAYTGAGAGLQELRLSSNGLSLERGLAPIAEALGDACFAPRLLRLDLSSLGRGLPARPASYCMREALVRRHNDRHRLRTASASASASASAAAGGKKVGAGAGGGGGGGGAGAEKLLLFSAQAAAQAAADAATQEAVQLGPDGLPRRFVGGRRLLLPPTRQRAAMQRSRAAAVLAVGEELVVVLAGGFEVSESEATGKALTKSDHVLGANHEPPRSRYFRPPPPSSSSSSSSSSNSRSSFQRHRTQGVVDSYPLTALVRRAAPAPTIAAAAASSSLDGAGRRRLETGAVVVLGPRAADRAATLEAPAGRAFHDPSPATSVDPFVLRSAARRHHPSQLGSASRPLGGKGPRLFAPLSMHDEKPALRDSYTHLTKAIVLPRFVHSKRDRGAAPAGL